MLSKPDSALVLVGHGSTLNPDSSAPTYQHAEAIRQAGIFKEVVCAFWKEEPSMREVLRMLDSQDVYVVPNFISEGYFTRTIIPRELGINGPVTVYHKRTIKYCSPVGNHKRTTDVLLHRAHEVAPDVPKELASLVIVGHGTFLNDNSAAAVREQAQRISALNLYGEVLPAYMEEEPLVSDWALQTRMAFVVVVPFFISDGLHSYQDIPVLLGIEEEPTAAASQNSVFRRNPYRLKGREVYYAGAIGTDPLFAEVILDQVRAFDAQHQP